MFSLLPLYRSTSAWTQHVIKFGTKKCHRSPFERWPTLTAWYWKFVDVPQGNARDHYNYYCSTVNYIFMKDQI